MNPAASHSLVGKTAYRRNLVQNQSAACSCIYAFASAGYTESTSDLIFSGHSVMAENGHILAEQADLPATDYMLVQDCDLGRIRAERRKNATFRSSAQRYAGGMLTTVGGADALRSDGSLYPLQKLPFIPSTKTERHIYCNEIFQLQVTGLKQRLTAIGGANAVIGISGGLDSTLALLVAVEAMRQLGRPTTDVYGVTMPCFGTSDRTYQNAWELMRTLGINAKEISIKNAVTLHFEDIGHDMSVRNGTYENSQARERTQILMDVANQLNGMVIGTGDLSELALGWATYNGDHMSMYAVNASVPKTLVRHVVEFYANRSKGKLKAVLEDILDTPVSPELIPSNDDTIKQVTEDIVGPYILHDYFLYSMIKRGFSPSKIYYTAVNTFKGVISKWF